MTLLPRVKQIEETIVVESGKMNELNERAHLEYKTEVLVEMDPLF